MYATALLRDPATMYRQVDVAGRTAHADGPALVQLLYEELSAALRAAGATPIRSLSECPALFRAAMRAAA